MNNSFLDKGDKSIANLFEQTKGLCFRELRMLLEILFQIAIADLLYDVVVMTAFHNIHHLDDVLGFKKLQNLNLGEESTF